MKLKAVSGIMLTLLMVSLVIVLASSIPIIAKSNPKTTMVFFDLPTINGTAIGVGNTTTVNIKIQDAFEVSQWQAGLIFNLSLLECMGFYEGNFLSSVGSTMWVPGTIDNTAGLVTAHSCMFYGETKASGNGTLGYLTFKVIALGVSDLHLRDTKVVKMEGMVIVEVAINIIDVYTVVVGATAHKVVTVSDSTGLIGATHSGFYDHAFNLALEEVSFKVTGPRPGFSNVSIPTELLKPKNESYGWAVIIDGNRLSTTEPIVTENTTHTSIYFTYTWGIHTIQITTQVMLSTISMALSSTNITLGSNVTTSGDINPLRPNVNVTILYRSIGETGWTTLVNVTTDLNSNYSYAWYPAQDGIYESKTFWEGDDMTLGAESIVRILTVEEVPVGGVWIPVDKLELLAPYIGLTILLAVAVTTVDYVKKRKKNTKINS